MTTPATCSYRARHFADGEYPGGTQTDLDALVIDWEDPVLDIGTATVVLRANDSMVASIAPEDYIAIDVVDFDGTPTEVCVMIVDSDSLIAKDPSEEANQTATYTGPLLLGALQDGPIEPPLGDDSFPIVDDVHFDDSHPDFDWSAFPNAHNVMTVWDAKRNIGGALATPGVDGRWGYLQVWAADDPDEDEFGTHSPEIIWASDGTPDGLTTGVGNCDFGDDPFTTTFDGMHLAYITGDNTVSFYVDGAEIGSGGTGGNPLTSAFEHTIVVPFRLSPGTHYPVLRGVNFPPFGAPNPGGVNAQIWIPGNPFDPANPPHLVWTASDAMKVIEYWTTSPGMTPGHVARLWLEGEQTRGRFAGWSLSCTDSDDTNGDAWSVTPTISMRVGTDDGLSLFLKMMEAYADVRIRPGGLVIDLYNKDAMTAASGVAFEDGNLTSLAFNRIRITADELLNRSQFGWTRVGANGRRVGSFTFGPEDNLDEINRLETALLAVTSTPRDMTSLTYKPRDNSELPGANANLVKGSTATVPTRAGGTTTDRIVSIGGRWSKDSETCLVRVTVKDLVLQNAERLLRAIKALGA